MPGRARLLFHVLLVDCNRIVPAFTLLESIVNMALPSVFRPLIHRVMPCRLSLMSVLAKRTIGNSQAFLEAAVSLMVRLRI